MNAVYVYVMSLVRYFQFQMALVVFEFFYDVFCFSF